MLRLYVHRVRCGSWACPRCGWLLGRTLCALLAAGEAAIKAKGLRYVLISLTFDPERFVSPRDAMESAKRGRWVAECLRKWQVRRGVHVEYLSKWELRDSGWPHVHVLLVVPIGLRFKNPKTEGGEFDDFWLYGFSNVSWQDAGKLSAYTSKVAAYTTKEASSGCEALEASGLSAAGFHWVQPSRGFWKLLGVKPVDTRYVGRSGDEVMRDDEGRAGDVVVNPHRVRWASHAERVASCGASSALVVEGGMSDERSRADGGHGSTFTVEIGCRRSALGFVVGDDCFDVRLGGVVDWANEEKRIVAGRHDVRPTAFLAWLRSLPSDWTAGVDLGEVYRRLGWLGERPTDESVPERSGGAVKCGT
jgi:hypothetical protein